MKINPILAAIAGLAVGIAVSNILPTKTHEGGMEGMNHSTMSDAPHATAFDQANAQMHAAMNIMYTTSADHDFAKGMIAHHQGAVDMAKVELEFGTDPEILAFAQAVIDAQTPEIEFMQNWLAAHPQ